MPPTHPYSWCSACGAPLPAEVKAQLSNPYTRPMSPAFVSLREDAGPDEQAVDQAIDEMLAPPPPNRMALILTASVVLFAVAEAAGGASRLSIVVLVAVLFVHESGHYLAMWAFGYQNVRMFFIPFLGAAVSSPSTHLAAWKEGIVLLAGPVPGIVAGLLAIPAGVVTGAPWWRDVAGVAIAVNAFNLLPLEPLDGGQLLRLTVFGRWRHAETAFRVVTSLALAAFGVWSGAWLMGLFAVSLVFAVRLRHRVLAAAARLRADHPAMSRDLQTLGPDQRRVLYADALDALPPEGDKTATAVAGTMRALLEALRPGPGLMASLVLLAAWAGTGVLAAAGVLVLALPPADWAVRACPNMQVTARFPAEPHAATEMVDGRRADICYAGSAGAGFVTVTRLDVGKSLDRAARVAAWPLLASPEAVERVIDGRVAVDVPLTAERMIVRFVFDGTIAYRVIVPNGDGAVAQAVLDSLRLPARP